MKLFNTESFWSDPHVIFFYRLSSLYLFTLKFLHPYSKLFVVGTSLVMFDIFDKEYYRNFIKDLENFFSPFPFPSQLKADKPN